MQKCIRNESLIKKNVPFQKIEPKMYIGENRKNSTYNETCKS